MCSKLSLKRLAQPQEIAETNEGMMSNQAKSPNFISIAQASKELGVSRTSVYYYLERLEIATQKFPLDKRTYISIADFERIKAAKQAAAEGSH
jgi:biotin operon repressor